MQAQQEQMQQVNSPYPRWKKPRDKWWSKYCPLKPRNAVTSLTSVANIKLTKPERGAKIEAVIIQNCWAGKFTGKVSDDMLKDLIETITKAEGEMQVETKWKKQIDSSDDEIDIDKMFG